MYLARRSTLFRTASKTVSLLAPPLSALYSAPFPLFVTILGLTLPSRAACRPSTQRGRGRYRRSYRTWNFANIIIPRLYEDVVTRLAQMEKLVEELQTTNHQGSPQSNEPAGASSSSASASAPVPTAAAVAATSSVSPLTTQPTPPAAAVATTTANTSSAGAASVSVSASHSPLSRRKASSASPSSGNPETYPSPPSASSSTGARPYYVGAPSEQVVAAAGKNNLTPLGIPQSSSTCCPG